MSLEIEYQNFNKLIDSYVDIMHVGNLKIEIEELSNLIIKESKKATFVEIAFKFLMTKTYEKQKFVLVSTLLKDKFKYDFEIIEKEKLLDIYKKLCEIAYLIGVRHQFIQTKSFAFYTNIALALAYIYIQISANSQERLEIFLAPFLPKDPQHFTLYNYYFKILEYVASQVYNKKLVIDEEYRQTIRKRLILQQYSILFHLNDLVPTIWDKPQIQKSNIIQCFIQWIIIHYNIQIMNNLPNHFIINKIFQQIFVNQRSEELAKSLKEIVMIMRVPKDTPQLYQYLAKKMMELLSIIKTIELDDQYQAQEYLDIVVDFCCKSVHVFAATFDDSIYLFLKKIIEYTKGEYLDVYHHVVYFWEQFLQEIQSQRATITIKPQIYMLISDMYDAMCTKCHYPIDFIKKLNHTYQQKLNETSQAGEDIYKKRQNSQQIFELMANIIGKKDFINYVLNKIKEVVTNRNQKVMWPYLQVYLFSLVHALKSMENYVPQLQNIIQIYQQLLANNNIQIPVIVKRTFLKIMRSLMSMKQKNPLLIQNLFIYSISALSQKMLEDTANKNIQVGCKYNHELLISLGKCQELLTLVQKYPYRQQIIRGVVYLIKPYENLTNQYFFHILQYISEELIKLDHNKTMRKHLMNCLTGIMKVLNQSAEKQKYKTIIFNWIKTFWPYIIKNLTTPRGLDGDEDVQVERIVKLLKLVLRCLKFQFAELIDSLYSSMLSAFKLFPICSYAYLIEVAITVYYQNPQYTQYFKNVYINFCGILSDHLSTKSNYEGFSYLLDDFIGMNKRFFIYNANILLNSGKFPYIIDLCIKTCVGCETPRIAKASYDFFQSIFMIYWRKQFIDEFNQKNPKRQPFKIKSQDQPLYLQLKKFFSDRLEYILSKILEHLYKVPTQATINYIIDVLIAELYAFPTQNVTVWPKLLQMFPADILVANQKYRFMQYLKNFCSPNTQIMKEASQKLKQFIFLIKNRMIYSNKRQKALM